MTGANIPSKMRSHIDNTLVLTPEQAKEVTQMGSAAILKAIDLNPSPHLVINLLGDVTLKVLNDRVPQRRNFDLGDTSADGWAAEEERYICLDAEMCKQKDQVDEQQLQLTWFMQKVVFIM